MKSLLTRAKLAHPDIADDIGSGKGIILQNYDSRIADAILTNLMAQKYPGVTSSRQFYRAAATQRPFAPAND